MRGQIGFRLVSFRFLLVKSPAGFFCCSSCRCVAHQLQHSGTGVHVCPIATGVIHCDRLGEWKGVSFTGTGGVIIILAQ